MISREGGRPGGWCWGGGGGFVSGERGKVVTEPGWAVNPGGESRNKRVNLELDRSVDRKWSGTKETPGSDVEDGA